MRLRLEMLDGRQARAARVSDLTAPFSVGTGAEATWALRSDQGIEGHALFQRDGSGMILTASGEVTVEGRPVGSSPVTVSHGNVITVAGRQFRLTVETGSEGAFGIDAPSISAILSDIAPGGASADGPLPGHAATSPLDMPAQARPSAERYWQEPRAFAEEETTLRKPAAILPDDWAEDSAELSDRTSQGAAPLGRTNVNPPSPTAVQIADTRTAKRQEGDDPALALAALAQALDALALIEDGLQSALADLGIATLAPSQALTAAALMADRDGHARAALALRVQSISGMQQAIMAGGRKAIAQAAQRLDPDSIIRDSKGGLAAKITPATGYWAEFRARMTPGDADPPLSDRALAEQIRAALGRKDQTKDE